MKKKTIDDVSILIVGAIVIGIVAIILLKIFGGI
jgi:hypothetical protein